jgi:hypothetical protein
MKHNEHVGRANASYFSNELRDEAIREYEQEYGWDEQRTTEESIAISHKLPMPTSFSEWLEQNGDSI